MNFEMPIGTIAFFVGAFAVFLLGWNFAKWVLSLRRVVPTNEVHIVQRGMATVSYGKDTQDQAGNVYYEWPSWIPVIGVSVIKFQTSVFKLDLQAYEAYDKGRLPFEIDVVSFFRIVDSNMAASRVTNFAELKDQLSFILKGAARTILASYDIDEIMTERSKFGEHFTNEVQNQLTNWGVQTVKNIELMDIRDGEGNQVIENIMAKKKSFIEMESRKEVASNMQQAETAEITAKQEVDLRKEQATQAVGEREALRVKEVGVANEKAKQEIKEQERVTKEKDMAVLKVQEVTNQEITKEKSVVKAKEDQETSIIRAEGQKQQTVLVAQGDLDAQKMQAEGIKVEGEARAAAEKAMQLAPVEAQIVLAKEIGENQGYQSYLQNIETIKANQVVGVEQAKALVAADVKIIANTGNAPDGMNNVMQLFTPKGGTNLAGAVEAMSQSDMGKAVLAALGVKQPAGNDSAPAPVTEETTGRKKSK